MALKLVWQLVSIQDETQSLFLGVALVPLTFIDTHTTAGMNTKAAIGKQVGRIGKDHINRIFRELFLVCLNSQSYKGQSRF